MDYFAAQDFFKKMYSGKEIQFSLDEKCHRKYECIITDGKANEVHHIECDKLKMTMDGVDQYIPIMPHRLGCTWDEMKKLINSK